MSQEVIQNVHGKRNSKHDAPFTVGYVRISQRVRGEGGSTDSQGDYSQDQVDDGQGIRVIRRAYVYKLKPNKTQLAQLEATLETCRRLYNDCLWERRECWDQHPDEDPEVKRVTASMQKKAHVTERRAGPDKRIGKRASARWKKAKSLLAKQHDRVSNTRKEFHRRTVASLVKRFDTIAVEDLNIAGMIKNHNLAKHIADVGWGYFVSMLETKAESAGRTVTKVPAQYTSQDCSGCGNRVPKKLSQRWHSCPFCGLQLHRDENAARNVKERAESPPSGRKRGCLLPENREPHTHGKVKPKPQQLGLGI